MDAMRMRHLAITLLAVAGVLGTGAAQAAGQCSGRSGPTAGALLELYTSEGCSSCPPADHWFGELAARSNPATLPMLAFHVDYWDQLGWKDAFSQHAFTRRQYARVHAAGSSVVYTPQLMASTHTGLRWNAPGQVAQVLAGQRADASRYQLALQVTPVDGGWRVALGASPSAAAVPGTPMAYLALAQDGLSSQVARGENAGARLAHARVVRGLWGPWPIPAGGLKRDLVVHPPRSARAGSYQLVAFVQDPASGRTWQALGLPLASCR
jgi:hypothetical protein